MSAFAIAIFSDKDVEQFAAANKKFVMEEKQRLLQEWAADALVDAILNPKSPSRVNYSAVPIEQIKTELASGKTSALVWTANHVFFNKEMKVDAVTDCRSELYDGPCLTEPQYWQVCDEHDRRRPILVEDAARMAGVYETLQNHRPYRHGGGASASILAVLKHTDFLPLLASRFGSKFSCSYTMEQDGEETQYWTPYIIRVFLQFWPDGLEKSKAEAAAKAKADFDRRSESVIVSTCMTCKKGLTRFSRIESGCLKDCHCREHDGYFCSDACMGPYFHRA
jgi:hypothetical protein